MSDPRDDLAALIEETITPLTRGFPDFYGEAFTAIAEAILARWRLVPVEEPTRIDPARYRVTPDTIDGGDWDGPEPWAPTSTDHTRTD
jgi:hypothetical protein